jgi:hypothetical protein
MRNTVALLSVLVLGCGDNIVPELPDAGTPPSAVPNDLPDMKPGELPNTAQCLGPPTLRVIDETAKAVTLEVCANELGLPGGFTVAWDPLCGAGFGEQNFGCRFALEPNECTNVTVGRLFDEEPGVAFTCDELACGTDYTFHAYANQIAGVCVSEVGTEAHAATLACEPVNDGCTLTQGYWKNHETWPVGEVAIGYRLYTEPQLLAAFKTPARGNGLVILAHQLAAAKLNLANGANGAAIAETLEAADTLVGDRIVPPLGDGYIAPAVTAPLADTLAAFNEGAIGPGHCAY